LLEEHGVETAQGLIKSSRDLLRKQTVNRCLSRWRLNQPRLLREPPAVRFQAENSNDCWQFDMSPSDLRHIERPDWVDPARGERTLMLFRVVDDRGGVAYKEYRYVYGEDAESALRFLFNAMAPKVRSDFPFQGRPKMLYLDNGPVAKSHVFQNVMQSLKVDWLTHTLADKDGTRMTARAGYKRGGGGIIIAAPVLNHQSWMYDRHDEEELCAHYCERHRQLMKFGGEHHEADAIFRALD